MKIAKKNRKRRWKNEILVKRRRAGQILKIEMKSRKKKKRQVKSSQVVYFRNPSGGT